MSMWDYLLENAKFYSPKTFGETVNSNPVNDAERLLIANNELPKQAFCDSKMVDTLIDKLKEYLETKSISPSQRGELDRLFQPVVDEHGSNPNWEAYEREADVSQHNHNLPRDAWC